jgi:hypothetical protein
MAWGWPSPSHHPVLPEGGARPLCTALTLLDPKTARRPHPTSQDTVTRGRALQFSGPWGCPLLREGERGILENCMALVSTRPTCMTDMVCPPVRRYPAGPAWPPVALPSSRGRCLVVPPSHAPSGGPAPHAAHTRARNVNRPPRGWNVPACPEATCAPRPTKCPLSLPQPPWPRPSPRIPLSGVTLTWGTQRAIGALGLHCAA